MANFSFYKCHESYCSTTYAVENDKVDEPICPVCGCHYFTHIQDIEVEVKEVDIDAKVQMEQEGISQGSSHNELRTA